jgi:MGT family glycosyltransferase
MQRLIDTLAAVERLRVVVSLGPQHELLRVPEGMTGAEYLPQTEILRAADLVITHGGNNTVTECMHYGCPMIVLPLFWDQHDNAARVAERGFGIRLDTYGHRPAALRGAVESVLADADLRSRIRGVAERLQAAPGTLAAADAIERVAGG